MLVSRWMMAIVTVASVSMACTRFPGPVQQPPATDRGGITVSGECLRKVVQDRGSVMVSSTTVLATPREASEKVFKSHEQLKVKIKALNLKDFVPETSGYSVNEERAYENKKWVRKGYRATLTSTFETSEIPRLGEIISAASESGAENVGALNIYVSPEKLKTEREACLETATENAAAKAARIAAGAGVKVDRLLGVSENASNAHRFAKSYYAEDLSAIADMAEEPTADQSIRAPMVEAKAVDLAVSVKATFGISN